jgi:hypothetical protein
MVNYPGLPLPAELLSVKLWIYEVVYFPLETELLRVARRMGCRTLNGAGMAIFQAVEAFRLFTGIKDLTISLDHARDRGVPLFMAATAMQMFQAGITKFPKEDNWAIAKILEDLAGTEVRR